MKKYIFSALAIAAMMVSCNNASPKMDDQPASGDTSASGLKIAYVEVDSLMTQYDYAKDYGVTLQKKSNNARNTLTQKGNALQAAVNNFQQKLNNNGFTSDPHQAGRQHPAGRQEVRHHQRCDQRPEQALQACRQEGRREERGEEVIPATRKNQSIKIEPPVLDHQELAVLLMCCFKASRLELVS